MKRRDFIKLSAAVPFFSFSLPEERIWYPWPYDGNIPKLPMDDLRSKGDMSLFIATYSNIELREVIRKFYDRKARFGRWWFEYARRFPRTVESFRQFWGYDISPGWAIRSWNNPRPSKIVDEEQAALSRAYCDCTQPCAKLEDFVDKPFYEFLKKELKKSERHARLTKQHRSAHLEDFVDKPFYEKEHSPDWRRNHGPTKTKTTGRRRRI
jgi:hypothetical protein